MLTGDPPAAVPHPEAALSLHREVGLLCGEALTLQRMAQARLVEGDSAVARRALDEAFIAARGSPVATRHLLDRIHGTAIKAAPDPSAAVVAVDEAGPVGAWSTGDMPAVLGEPVDPRRHRLRRSRRPRTCAAIPAGG